MGTIKYFICSRRPVMEKLDYRIHNAMNRYWTVPYSSSRLPCRLLSSSSRVSSSRYAHIMPFQFRTRPRTWYSFGIRRIPSWLTRRSSCRSSIYRTTTRPIVRSNTRPETSRAYRLSSTCAGDWAITCSTHTYRPP